MIVQWQSGFSIRYQSASVMHLVPWSKRRPLRKRILPGWFREVIGWAALLIPLLAWADHVGTLALAFPSISLSLMFIAHLALAWKIMFGDLPKTPQEHYRKLQEPGARKREYFNFRRPLDWALLLATPPFLLLSYDLLDHAGTLGFAWAFEREHVEAQMSGKTYVGWTIAAVLTFPVWAAVLATFLGRCLPRFRNSVDFGIALSPAEPQILEQRSDLTKITEYGSGLGRPKQITSSPQGAQYELASRRKKNDKNVLFLLVARDNHVLRIEEEDSDATLRKVTQLSLQNGILIGRIEIESSRISLKVFAYFSGPRRFAVWAGLDEITRLRQVSDTDFRLLTATPKS